MTAFQFDVAFFRSSFPAFGDATKYPDEMLQSYWDAACCFISPVDFGSLHGDCRFRALNLMTAHIAQTATQAGQGQPVTVALSATVGAVSVSSMPPPIKSRFQYWLYTTPYGVQLAALLGLKGVGGIYVGGLPEKSAFRKVGGTFAG